MQAIAVARVGEDLYLRRLCLHCRARRQHKPERRLCRICTRDPDLRAKYPTEAERRGSRFSRMSHRHTPSVLTAPTLPEPTSAMPGTPEKIAVLTERFAKGQQLWHRCDARPDPEWDEEAEEDDDYDLW